MTVLLSAHELTKAFGLRPLFAGLSLHLAAGERIGLIGPNGAGKSTLLKILAGQEPADAGTVTARRSTRIGYVPQDDVFPADQTARGVLLAALAHERADDYELMPRVERVLTQVGFADREQLAANLSGGWRKRLGLARALVQEPDLVLMDEPTNHLDLPGVRWLERLLRAASFGYVVATHDRAFLRAVADDIVEISRVYPAGVFRATGGYDAFADHRDTFLAGQARQQEAVANQVRRETEWLGRKAAARTRKASSRIEAAADRRGELAELRYRTAAATTAGIDFAGTGRKTTKLLTATGLSAVIKGRSLFAGLDVQLTPGTSLGLLGPNGSGKSTLLRMLAGQRAPDTGTVARAEQLRLEMFEQGRSSLEPSQSLRKALSPNTDTVQFRDRQLHVVSWAKQFLFRPDQLDLEVGTLSGGEQARVRIAQLMLRPADVLLLDEPTNDLDIPALEVLEESLADFPGALVIVSHDRDLLDRLCTDVIGLDGQGGAALYGSVEQWLTAYEARQVPVAAPVKPKLSPPPPPKAKKMSYKEQQELEGMETALLTAEEAVTAGHAAVEAAASAGHQALAKACADLEAAQQTVERLYARWQELEAKRGG
jgi:ATP-binding cassette subfamily F protein uup